MRKTLFLISLLSVAACGEPEPVISPTTVSVSTPLERKVADWDEYIGRFEAIDDVEVRPRVSGQIDAIYIDDGEDVERDAPLFRIDPRPFEAARNEARAAVASAEASRANARTELARARELSDARAISTQDLEQRTTALSTAEAAVEAAKARLEARELDVSFTTVTAPISGRVSARSVSTGDSVAAGTTPLIRIVSLDPIWFAFEGAESFYLKYLRQDRGGERQSSRSAANPVHISLADETDYRWRGEMDFVDSAIDPLSSTIRAHAILPNPDGFLAPGMFGRARLLGSGEYDALLVPDEAIVTDQNRKLVYVVNAQNEIVVRPVETGPLVEGLRVVRDGLTATDRIVLDGLARVQPGQTVETTLGALTPRSDRVSPAAAPAAPPSARVAAEN